MNKQAFTVARVEGFACEPGKQQTIFWDTRTPGFGVRATASGARAYIFEARLFGKTIRTTIGGTRSWELGNARAEANRQRGLIDRDIDPREDRVEKEAAHAARRTAAKRRSVTFGEAWDEYVAARKPSWAISTIAITFGWPTLGAPRRSAEKASRSLGHWPNCAP